MKAEADTPNETRHRVLEGVLLRLVRRPDFHDFILRGGMLLRHWFRPLWRPAEDLDLVVTFPFDIEDAARRFLPILDDSSVNDGVTFDTDATRYEGIWLESGYPGARLFLTGMFEQREADFHVDLTFGPFPRPAPVLGELPTAFGEVARIWMCGPESIIGHKLQALCHRGMLGWRPKDLNDIRLIFACVPVNVAHLRTAIATYLADVGRTNADLKELFSPWSWWSRKFATSRWLDFVNAAQGQDVPLELPAVAAEVAEHLAPVLEGSP